LELVEIGIAPRFRGMGEADSRIRFDNAGVDCRVWLAAELAVRRIAIEGAF